LNIIYLQNFLAIIKYKSYSAAALELCITQSSLSKHIMALEKELGVELFDRSKRDIRLTPAGHVLHRHAETISGNYKEMLKEIKDFNTQEKSTIRIAAIPVLTQYSIPGTIAKFKEKYPHIAIELCDESQQSKLLTGLNTGKFDMAIMRTDFLDERQYLSWPLAEDELSFVVSKNHPLADRKSVSLSELKDEKFILINPEAGLSDICLNACHEAGFEPIVQYTIDRVETIMGLVAIDEGVTLFMRRIIGYFNNPDICIIPISNHVRSITALVKSVNQKMKPAERLLVDFLKDCC
jgi:LysR family transcriptional regulator, transcription activator of glutamate synthase operon